jgi:hypothetical protein
MLEKLGAVKEWTQIRSDRVTLSMVHEVLHTHVCMGFFVRRQNGD